MADQAAEGLLSPFLKQQRFNVAIPYLKGDILDVGCGAGALAQKVSPDNYLGVEIEKISLQGAISGFPTHKFTATLPDEAVQFDTIISLAVIEHVKYPESFLNELSKRLKPIESSRVVITTPHPSMEWVHSVGASIGLFSKHANEEHEELLDYAKLESAGIATGLEIVQYKRFLFGANQLAVFKKKL